MEGSKFSFVDWLLDSNPKGTSSNLMGLIGMGANLYGAHKQQQMANKQFELQKQAFDFNKMLSNREIARQNVAENNLQNAWASSMLNPMNRKKKEKEEELGY